MSSIDEWLKSWLSAKDLAKKGEYRSPGPLHVYAMAAGAGGPQFSGELSSWADLSGRLSASKISLGLVALETPVDYAFSRYPGVTLAFESPFGGSVVARDVMNKLGRLGIGGVLAETDRSGRFGVLRILMTPRWYAQSGDRLFGLDWSKVPNDPVHCDEAKKAWALGVHDALRKALADLPSMIVDTVSFGAFEIVDWLHDLGPRESAVLYGAKPRQLQQALGKLCSYDLDELSSERPRPFNGSDPLLVLHDALEDDAPKEWLMDQLSSPDCLLLHVRGRAAGLQTDLMLVLLRRGQDGRIRLTVARYCPFETGVHEDEFEVDPAVLAWPKDRDRPVKGADAVLNAFLRRYGDVHDAGTLHARLPIISDSGHRDALTTWFQQSESSAADHQLVKDLRRRVHVVMREPFEEEVEDRKLSKKEADDLYGWLTEEGQQKVELEWFLSHWRRRWHPKGLVATEVEKFFV